MELRKKQEVIWITCIATILFVITYILVSVQIKDSGTDYAVHAGLALELSFANLINYSYPIWHICVKVLYNILKIGFAGITIYDSASIFSAIVNAITYVVIVCMIRNSNKVIDMILAASLLIMGPIYLPWYNGIYLGQGSPNTWHNPTNLMVKPFAIIIFFLFVKFINDERENKKNNVFLCILCVISLLAKPAFLQGFAPAGFIYLAWHSIRRKSLKKILYYVLIMLPSAVVILMQLFVNFDVSGGGIKFEWFKMAGYYSPNPVFSTLLVVAFPLLFTICYLKVSINSTDIKLAWMWLVVAWLEYALLYEGGPRMYHGNFWWSLLLSYSLLWIVTTKKFFVTISDDKENIMDIVKNTILMILWMLHLCCGIYYVIYIGGTGKYF